MSGSHTELLESVIGRHPALAGCSSDICAATDTLIVAYEQGGKLLLCGNGGSAADCEHIATRIRADVQELRAPVHHYLCRALEAHFFPE